MSTNKINREYDIQLQLSILSSFCGVSKEEGMGTNQLLEEATVLVTEVHKVNLSGRKLVFPTTQWE